MSQPLKHQQLIELVKLKLAISSSARDQYIDTIIDGIIHELTSIQGISWINNDSTLDTYIYELASFRYLNTGDTNVPQYLKFMLNNLIVRGLKDEKQE